MSEFERHAAGKEARHGAHRRQWTTEVERREDLLRRYLGAVATTSSTAGEAAPEEWAVPARTGRRAPAHLTAPRVGDVMRAPAVSVPGDTSFLEVARTLAHEHLGAVPVVDAEAHVVGMVSESDLLAKAAVMAITRRPGPLGKLKDRRLHEKSRGETAATLMTYPAVTVHPADTVADAAWTAARSRLKRLPVTDYRDRLVGVVTRADLLRSLVRDDTEIREEIECRILRGEHHLEPDAIEVTVEGGVVTVEGRVDVALAPGLVESIRAMEGVDDVVDHLTGVT
ncbi:CBS domain-containing protein [Streptomyces sp. 4503]|uniref:CBS domain-containing protein n=1 Tax=Streptomyces niphimycinicus TaxID=2842201 RepID=A0ABS6CTT2_9ACTN|nr:CBS domain-containing protein [Streptomyces niphimycinicus]MBU3870373.1 CBS domain-containing protein [Streptomyces niphimycinicus]